MGTGCTTCNLNLERLWKFRLVALQHGYSPDERVPVPTGLLPSWFVRTVDPRADTDQFARGIVPSERGDGYSMGRTLIEC